MKEIFPIVRFLFRKRISKWLSMQDGNVGFTMVLWKLISDKFIFVFLGF